MADSFVRMRRAEAGPGYGRRFYFGFSHFANGRSPKTPEVQGVYPSQSDSDNHVIVSDSDTSVGYVRVRVTRISE